MVLIPGLFLSVKDSSLLLGFLGVRIFFPQCPSYSSPFPLPGSTCITGDEHFPLLFLGLQKVGPFLTDGGDSRLPGLFPC